MTMVSRYQKHLSGLPLGRIDIHGKVPRVDCDKLSDERLVELSRVVRARVEAAHERERARFARTALLRNADMGPGKMHLILRGRILGIQSLLEQRIGQGNDFFMTGHMA